MCLGTNPGGVELLLRWNPDGAIFSRLCALSTVKNQCRRGFRGSGKAEVRADADVEDAGLIIQALVLLKSASAAPPAAWALLFSFALHRMYTIAQLFALAQSPPAGAESEAGRRVHGSWEFRRKFARCAKGRVGRESILRARAGWRAAIAGRSRAAKRC